MYFFFIKNKTIKQSEQQYLLLISQKPKFFTQVNDEFILSIYKYTGKLAITVPYSC
jgi:hypothetical protein